MAELMHDVGPDAVDDSAHILVSSRRVEGTPVFGGDGKRVGSIHSVMINKATGQVAYAVLSFGGLLGIGSHVYPVPWEMLTYSSQRRGYQIDLTREAIEAAPALRLDDGDRPTSRPYEEPLFEYYGAPHYWTR